MEKLGSRMGSAWPKVSPKPLESPSAPLQPINFRQLPSTRSLFVLQQHLATWAGVGAVGLPQPAVTIPICEPWTQTAAASSQESMEKCWSDLSKARPQGCKQLQQEVLEFQPLDGDFCFGGRKISLSSHGVSLQLSGGWGRQNKLRACCWQKAACSGHELSQELGVMFQFITEYWDILFSFNGPRVLYVLGWFFFPWKKCSNGSATQQTPNVVCKRETGWFFPSHHF